MPEINLGDLLIFIICFTLNHIHFEMKQFVDIVKNAHTNILSKCEDFKIKPISVFSYAAETI